MEIQGIGLFDSSSSNLIPRAKSASCAATATAAPLHDPPGTSDGEAGLIGVPQCKFSPVTLTKHGKLACSSMVDVKEVFD